MMESSIFVEDLKKLFLSKQKPLTIDLISISKENNKIKKMFEIIVNVTNIFSCLSFVKRSKYVSRIITKHEKTSIIIINMLNLLFSAKL